MDTLATTNVLLAIMTAMSLLEALAFLALLGGGVLLTKRLKDAVVRIEQQHLGPMSSRVTAILDDVKDVTSAVKDNTRRVDFELSYAAARAGCG